MTELPLSSRIVAPAEVELPDAGLTWRALTIDDVDLVTSLQQAIDLAEHPTWATTREEIEDELSHSYVDLQTDSLIGFDEDGDAVAYGLVVLSPGQETLVKSAIGGGVHPDSRGLGIGRELLAWQESRALQQLASSELTLPGWISAYAEEKATKTDRLLARAGFEKVRWFFALERRIADPIADVAIPEGVTIETYSPRHSAATRAAKNASFRDHWGSQPSTEEQWDTTVRMESFHEEVSFVAVAPHGEVIGFVLSWVVEDDWKLQGFSSGYIGLVGVVREWRRKGIAPALLSAAFLAYREAGYERAQLDVDADNPSGALGLYQGMGFTEKTRSVAYSKVY